MPDELCTAPAELGKIMVCFDGSYHFLRIFFSAGRGGTVCFDSCHAYTKPEADYRAMELSSRHGWNRDKLPTYPQLMAQPKLEED